MNWQEHRERIVAETSSKARDALSEKYAALTLSRLDLARSVGPRERTEGLHAILAYKEAFSPVLVREILDTISVNDGPLIDPFVGSGTTLLVAAERGLSATGVDIIPFAAFAANTLVRSHTADWTGIDGSVGRILNHAYRAHGTFPDFPVRDWAFSTAALAELSAIHDGIGRCNRGINRDVMNLALLSVVEELSQATKDGTSLRRRAHGGGRNGRFGAPRTRAQVRQAFESRLTKLRLATGSQPNPPDTTTAVAGDARLLDTMFAASQFGASVFSPPYPNRYDYVGNYQLELGFGFVSDRVSLRTLRRDQLRSHLEAPWPSGRTVKLDALDEFLASLLASPMRSAETGRVFKMVAGYFEDMSQVLDGLAVILKPGSPVAVVVGTQCFNGEPLPTDLLLAELAVQRGMTVEKIWVARAKGVAAQQRAKGASKVSSREVVLFLTTKRAATKSTQRR